MEEKQTRKRNIPMYVAGVLLALTLISLHMTSGLFARYTETVSGTDKAKTAKFSVFSDYDYITLGIAENEIPNFALGGADAISSASLPFYVSSRSEVAVQYSIEVDFGRALPEYVTLSLTDGKETDTITCDGLQTKYVFENFGTLQYADADEKTSTLSLNISVTDLSQITTDISIPEVKMKVMVEQID